MQSVDSFCFATQNDRPASAQSPYSPGPRLNAHARPASAAAPASRPRTQQLWQGLTRSQQAKPSIQAEDSGRTTAARADSPAGRGHATETSPERSKRCASPKQVVGVAAHHDKPTQNSSAPTRGASGEAPSPQGQAGSRPGSPQPGVIAEAAAEAGETTVTKTRPVTAQVQVKSPGVFLRKARPQSAGAANVTQAKAKATHLGVHAFNEPKRETGWVDFRAQNRMGSRVSQQFHVCYLQQQHAQLHRLLPAQICHMREGGGGRGDRGRGRGRSECHSRLLKRLVACS